MDTNSTHAEVCSSEVLGLEPTAYRLDAPGWKTQYRNSIESAQKYWKYGRRCAGVIVPLYTEEQLREAIEAERSRNGFTPPRPMPPAKRLF